MPGPRYYLPASNATLPAHLAGMVGGARLYEGKGPDAPSGPGGGIVYGGVYAEAEPGWLPVNGGEYWINFAGLGPQHLVRLHTSPRVRDWRTVQGAHYDHLWRVPALLTYQGDTTETPGLYASALDRIWTANGWADDQQMDALQRRLIAVAIGVANGDTEDDALPQLVADVLALGHVITLGELAALGWLSEAFLLRVLVAAAGIPVPGEPEPALSEGD